MNDRPANRDEFGARGFAVGTLAPDSFAIRATLPEVVLQELLRGKEDTQLRRSLRGHAEQACDEFCLSRRVSAVQPFNLSLPQHMKRFDSLLMSARRYETSGSIAPPSTSVE